MYEWLISVRRVVESRAIKRHHAQKAATLSAESGRLSRSRVKTRRFRPESSWRALKLIGAAARYLAHLSRATSSRWSYLLIYTSRFAIKLRRGLFRRLIVFYAFRASFAGKAGIRGYLRGTHKRCNVHSCVTSAITGKSWSIPHGTGYLNIPLHHPITRFTIK